MRTSRFPALALVAMIGVGLNFGSPRPTAAQLTPLTGELLVAPPQGAILSEPRMVPLPEGRFLVRWDEFFVVEVIDLYHVRYVEADGSLSPTPPTEILLTDPFPLASLRQTGELFNAELRGSEGQCVLSGQIVDPQFQPVLDLEPLVIEGNFCPLNLHASLLQGPRTALLYVTGNGPEDDLWFQRFDAHGNAAGSPFLVSELGETPDPDNPAGSHVSADLAVNGAGDGVATWLEYIPGEPTRLLARWINAIDGEATTIVELDHETSDITLAPARVAMAQHPAASMVVWPTLFEPFTLRAQVFHPDGTPRTAPFLVHQSDRSIPRHDIAADDSGRFAVVWTELASDDPFGSWNLFARLYNADGMPLGEVVQVNEGPFRATTPTVAFSDQHTVLVTWSREAGSENGAVLGRLFAAPLLPACAADGETLCLQGDRFTATVEWAEFQGNTGVGHVVPTVSDQSGLFWFFNPENWELMLKVLNGCGINDHYWVFSAATTNVEYTLTVTDTFSGEVRTYSNLLGVNAPAVTDTSAFATCP